MLLKKCDVLHVLEEQVPNKRDSSSILWAEQDEKLSLQHDKSETNVVLPEHLSKRKITFNNIKLVLSPEVQSVLHFCIQWDLFITFHPTV